ncbi:MAG: glycosyltransferase family 2 protein [Anaerolineae bacterium]|nr:glycosyltransferase family 2 protein [Anaerolineae bacterium]
MLDLTVVIPLLNEEDNLVLLYEKLTAVLTEWARPYELIFVDDGSTDRSLSILQEFYTADPQRVRIVQLRRNFGKTSAMVAGFQLAQGDVLITIDADLQDDPAEIPAMLAKLDEGYDLVVGWRKERMDHAKKKLSSRFYNTAVPVWHAPIYTT